ncbi:unnamed protein product [Clavelina lepadiformis]|uniref:Gag protein n=1 Tax=Clavelina lepadiformis TaxID=159417 RepID=A0ABP0G429_CLALP
MVSEVFVMEKSIPTPAPMKWSGNVHENWIRFIQSFKLYMTAIGHDSKSDKAKSSLLLCVMGEEALQVYNSFKFETGQELKFDNVVANFEAYCCPKKNITFERYKFHTCTQKVDQSIDEYVTQLKVIAKNCEFADLVESLIRDRVICGILDHKLQEALLREDTLTLDKAMSICRAKELSKSQASALGEKSTTSMSIDMVESKNANGQRRRNFNCARCGRDHQIGRCPAFGKSCYHCGGRNHFASFCNSSRRSQIVTNRRPRTVREVRVDDVQEDIPLHIDSIRVQR